MLAIAKYKFTLNFALLGLQLLPVWNPTPTEGSQCETRVCGDCGGIGCFKLFKLGRLDSVVIMEDGTTLSSLQSASIELSTVIQQGSVFDTTDPFEEWEWETNLELYFQTIIDRRVCGVSHKCLGLFSSLCHASRSLKLELHTCSLD